MQQSGGRENAPPDERFDIIYSNARILRVEPYTASGALAVIVTCDEREEQRILYEGVLYSQLDESAVGGRIAIAVTLTPDEYSGGRHKGSAERFYKDCGITDMHSLYEMARRGYRLYSHYIVGQDARVVIAKGLSFNR